MRQTTLATAGFERFGKATRRETFLSEMERVVPWQELCALIEPFYPKAGKGGTPVGLERMLRIHFLQQWFNLSDPAAEEAMYDSVSGATAGLLAGTGAIGTMPEVSRRAKRLNALKIGRWRTIQDTVPRIPNPGAVGANFAGAPSILNWIRLLSLRVTRYLSERGVTGFKPRETGLTSKFGSACPTPDAAC